MTLPSTARRRLLDFLNDDLGRGDVTSAITPEKICSATIYTKEPCVLAGVEESAFLFEHNGVKAKVLKKDGSALNGKTAVLRLHGSNRKIFGVVRTALNLLGRMSGVATQCVKAKGVVQAVSPRTRVSLTRKTIPGFAFFDKKAAVIAGINPHRPDLSAMVLLKDHHLKFFPDAAKAVEAARRKWGSSKKIEVEVTTTKQALDAAKAKPGVIMLDNFTAKESMRTVALLRKNGFRGEVELSGGINFENLRDYAKAKPDVISMGSLTTMARATDFSFKL